MAAVPCASIISAGTCCRPCATRGSPAPKPGASVMPRAASRRRNGCCAPRADPGSIAPQRHGGDAQPAIIRIMTGTDAIVVGGGLAGLSCAIALGEHGMRVTVLEAGDAAGGRARSADDPDTGDRVDLGPHILLSEYRNMRRLLEQLGTHGQVAGQGREFITFVDKPRPVTFYVRPLPAPLHFMPSLLRIPQLSMRDIASNMRLFWHVMRLRSDDVQRLDGESAEAALRRWGVSS